MGLKKFIEDLEPHFEKGGKHEKWFALYEAVAASGALKLASYKKITGTHFQMIQLQYKDAMKTAADHYANMQMRMPKHLDKDTIDNSDNTRFLT